MSLFNEFESNTSNQWYDRIVKDLKGKDFQENLVWESIEGIKVNPYYTSENLQENKSSSFDFSKANQTLENRFVVKIKSIEEANKKALFALSRGVNSIQFIGEIPSQNDFNRLMNEIDLSCISIHFYNISPESTVEYYTNFIVNNNLNLTNTNNSISYDYIGEILKRGNWILNQENDIEKCYQLIKKSNLLRSISINGINFNNAGATIVQELAYSFSQATEYINLLTDKGVKTEDLYSKFIFNFGIGSNFFFEIAKIRATKICWELILEKFNINASSIYINSTTSQTNMTCFDQHTNILRTTTAAMSAIIGGANSVQVLPFDSAFEKTTELSERIAINIQHILTEESYLTKVSSIANGAYYIESLTDELVEKTIALFKEIEQNGGFLKCISNGKIQQSILESAIKQQNMFNEEKKTLLGVNKHINKNSKLYTHSSQNNNSISTPIQPLTTIRFSEEIEKKYLKQTTEI